MSSSLPWLAIVAAVGALVVFGGQPRPLRWSTRRTAERPDSSILRRLRVPLSLLTAVGAWAFVGGVGGLVAAAVLAPLAWRTLTNARGPESVRREQRLKSDYPLVIELLSLALSAGADVATALELVADAVGDAWASRLATSLNALEVGQPPADVWADLERDPLAAGLGRALSRSHSIGVPVADAMSRLAEDLREDADRAAHAYARTIEVRAAVPLGLCFLPAFVLLGVVPMVVGVLSDLTWISGSG